MSTSAVRLLCPNLQCRTVLSVPAAARGKTVRCRNCSMRIQVPASGKPAGVAPEAQPMADPKAQTAPAPK